VGYICLTALVLLVAIPINCYKGELAEDLRGEMRGAAARSVDMEIGAQPRPAHPRGGSDPDEPRGPQEKVEPSPEADARKELTPEEIEAIAARRTAAIEEAMRPGVKRLMEGKILSGTFLPRLMMFLPLRVLIMSFLLTLFAAMAGGGAIAGEYSSGTLRSALVRPPHRWMVMLAKFVATAMYGASLPLFLGALSFAVGYAMFGSGPLIFFDMPEPGEPSHGGMGPLITPEGQAAHSLIIAYLLASASIAGMACFALFFSSFSSRTVSAAAGALGLVLVFRTLGALGAAGADVPVLSFFSTIRPYLITTHMDLYQIALKSSPDWGEALHSGLCLLAYCVGLLMVSILIFRRRDILC